MAARKDPDGALWPRFRFFATFANFQSIRIWSPRPQVSLICRRHDGRSFIKILIAKVEFALFPASRSRCAPRLPQTQRRLHFAAFRLPLTAKKSLRSFLLESISPSPLFSMRFSKFVKKIAVNNAKYTCGFTSDQSGCCFFLYVYGLFFFKSPNYY